MNYNKLATCCVIAAAPGLAAADTLSFAIGGGVWNETPEGSIIKPSNAPTPSVDVKNNLFWDEESQGYIFATLEHPVPIVPNVRLMYTSLDHAGSGTTSFTFEGTTYSGNVANEFTIDQTDLLLYWEVLDNVVSLDLGLNVRLLDISFKINDGTSTTDNSVSAPVPMVYGLIGGSPWPGLILSAEANYMTVAGSTISDFTAKIAYTTNFLIGFEAGYRTQTIELDDVDDTNANLDFAGPFIGAYLKF
jgi:outer membrane protein